MSVNVPNGYKQTKVGVIPEEWELVRLGDVVDFLDHKRKPIKSNDRQMIKGKFPYYGASGIIDYINDYIFDEELILLGEDGANIVDRSTRLVFLAKGKYWVNNHAHVFKSKDTMNNYFLCEYLESLNYEKYNTGTAQPKLNKDTISKILVKKPPIKEQQKIAQILTTWDKAISKQEALIAEKEKLKKGLQQKLLSGEVRFEGFDGEWEEVRLGDVVKIYKGKQLNKSTLTKEGAFPVINGGIEPSGYTNNFNTLENTITISEGGNSCGFVNLITEKFWSGGHCYTLQEIQVNNTFLYQSLKFNENRIMRLRVGSGLPNIQKKDIDNFKILSPSIEEQQKIAQILTTADKEIELLKEELEALKEQKRGLMQKLLTGKVRVKI